MIPYYTEKEKLDEFYNKFIKLYNDKNVPVLADFILNECGEFKNQKFRERKLYNVVHYLSILSKDKSFACKDQIEVDQVILSLWNALIAY